MWKHWCHEQELPWIRANCWRYPLSKRWTWQFCQNMKKATTHPKHLKFVAPSGVFCQNCWANWAAVSVQTSIHRISGFESPKMRGLPISVPKTLQFCSFLSNMSDAVKCKTITLCHTLSLSARFYSYQSSWQSSLRERGMLLPCRVCPIYQCSCSHFSCCVLCSISLDNITILPPVS